MTEQRDQVDVHLDDGRLGRGRVGRLARRRRDRTSVLSFDFDGDWLRGRPRLVLDPKLQFYEGEQHGNALFGVLADTAPDRWGRTLLQRREAATARREGRRPRQLEEWDFLLGVSDGSRMGALRLVDPVDQAFVSPDGVGIPPMARLRQLQVFAQHAERGEVLTSKQEDEELALLVAPGSSLGGARPKASFRDRGGALRLAKFPSRNDDWNVGAWEFVLNQLAAAAGIAVPDSELLALAKGHHTFTAARFDRTPSGRRLYASAMTLTEKRDHEDASYLDIVEAITRYGSAIRSELDEDLDQLFRRVVFNVLTANRDDHLRNHGFLGGANGWRLAPAFDLNPIPTKTDHAIALDEVNTQPDLDAVRQSAALYRVRPARVGQIIDRVRQAIAPWREVAARAGIGRSEVEMLAAAFEL